VSRELILVRHGQTEWNVARRLQGHGDSPLTALGRRQAAGHLDWLRAAPPEAILTSPLGRARDTAAILGDGLGLVPEVDEALRERALGRFEGWTLDEIRAAHPDEHARREADPWHWRPAGGEHYPDLDARVAPLLARLAGHPARRLLIVSHGTLARPLLRGLLGLDPPTTLAVLVPNDLAYEVDLAGGRVRHHRDGRATAGLLTAAGVVDPGRGASVDGDPPAA
jgi:broad specificity phosphatase PhoE